MTYPLGGHGVTGFTRSTEGYGNVLLLDGINDYYDLDTPVDISNNKVWTIGFDFNCPSFSNETVFGSITDNLQWVRLTNSTTILVRLGSIMYFTVPAMSVNTWTKCLIASDGTNCKIYLDSVLSATQTSVSTTPAFMGRVGARALLGNKFGGMLDNVFMKEGYTADQDDADDLYNGGNFKDVESVIGATDFYHKLNESGTDTVAVDSSANNNDGNLTNFTGTYWVAR